MESTLMVMLAIMLGAIFGIVVGLRRIYTMEKTILAIDAKLEKLIAHRRKGK